LQPESSAATGNSLIELQYGGSFIPIHVGENNTSPPFMPEIAVDCATSASKNGKGKEDLIMELKDKTEQVINPFKHQLVAFDVFVNFYVYKSIHSHYSLLKKSLSTASQFKFRHSQTF